MDRSFYFDKLYPLQDRALRAITNAGTEFYLGGGTAASRGYLQHRFSDDLDLFVNDDDRFGLWAHQLVPALEGIEGCQLTILDMQKRFARIRLTSTDFFLKIELINDVPARIGEIVTHESLGRLDSAENILANKITAAIDRQEPRDLADIWGFCRKMSLPLNSAIEVAHSKAAGIYPPDLARRLCSATEADWTLVQWIDPPDVSLYLNDLRTLGEDLIL